MVLALDGQDHIARQRKTARLQVLLQARLGIFQRLGRRQRRDALGEEARDERFDRREATIEENRPSQRLERIGQNRLAAKAAAAELTGAELQRVAQAERPGNLGERLTAH